MIVNTFIYYYMFKKRLIHTYLKLSKYSYINVSLNISLFPRKLKQTYKRIGKITQ